MEKGIGKNVSKMLGRSQDRMWKDRTTGLPTLISQFPMLETYGSQHKLGIIYLDINNFKKIETLYGRELCDRVLALAANIFNTVSIDFGGIRQRLGTCSMGGDDFLIFVDAPDDMPSFETDYTALKSRLEEELNRSVQGLAVTVPLTLHLGYTEVDYAPDYRIEAQIYKALKEASYAAKHYSSAAEHADWHLMRQILMEGRVTSVFQPIVSLKDGEILGYEALSRGPEDTIFEAPARLFPAAEHYQCQLDLENLCHQKAISGSRDHLAGKSLFLNINPLLLNQINYEKGSFQEMLRQQGVDCGQVVLELTERAEIVDYGQLRDSLSYYRRQGFKIALDDAGAGYSSLQAIVELHPDYVKIDMSLVRDIDKNPTKRAMLETLIDFTCKINARIICEGIEKLEELKVLCSMGCDYGQGFLLASPQDLIAQIDSGIKNQIERFFHRHDRNIYAPRQLGDISGWETPVSPEISVQKIVDMFGENKDLDGLVVCRDDIPLGLIMRDRLFSMLGTRYGFDLFIKRHIADIMDTNPLILPTHFPVEDAARRMAQRLERGISDYLIVTRDGSYYGVVSAARLLDTMARIQVEQARDANPLTGLPGNRCITGRIIQEIGNNKSKYSVLYLDLDNFKTFNDFYGFEQGDRVLLMVAQILVAAVSEFGNDCDLVGHIGGDDFIIVTTPDKAAAVAGNIVEVFDHRIGELYDPVSLEQGHIEGVNRQGGRSRFPIMTISIAGVSNDYRHFNNHLQLGEIAAEIKKLAKAQPGSSYITDRRKEA